LVHPVAGGGRKGFFEKMEKIRDGLAKRGDADERHGGGEERGLCQNKNNTAARSGKITKMQSWTIKQQVRDRNKKRDERLCGNRDGKAPEKSGLFWVSQVGYLP